LQVSLLQGKGNNNNTNVIVRILASDSKTYTVRLVQRLQATESL